MTHQASRGIARRISKLDSGGRSSGGGTRGSTRSSGPIRIGAETPVREARSTTAEIEEELRRLGGAVQHFARRNGGRLPPWLEDLVLTDEHGTAYLDSLLTLVDPWGRDYRVEGSESGATITLSTLGADGAIGGEGADADIRLDVSGR